MHRSPKKPKSKRHAAPQSDIGSGPGPSHHVSAKLESKEPSISMLVNEEKVGKKRKNYTVVEENGKKRKVVDVVSIQVVPPPCSKAN